MDNNNKTKYTFWRLISAYDIEIPIMQRDYAQGRIDEKANIIRGELLDTLYAALDNDSNSIDFDFVYGTEENTKMLPLDGQQRLTTLFLLHWYLAAKDVLTKFSYSTRISSREFCKRLVSDGVKVIDGNKLSLSIQDSNWYFKAWDSDPTIKAMLVMIDSIHEKFYSSEGLFEKLQRDISDKPPVTFRFVSLKNYGLTDNLYIKMNARGKPLTDFEKFKAKYFKFLKNQGYEEKSKYFESHIDNAWTDTFWEYREKNTIDNPFMRYFMFITEMLYAKSKYHPYAQTPFKVKGNLPIIDFKLIEQIYNLEENVDFLFKSLDMWNGKNAIDDYMGKIFSSAYSEEKVNIFNSDTNLLERCVKGRVMNIQDKILLFALIMRKTYISDGIDDCMCDFLRIIRNLLNRVRQLQDTTYNSNLRFEHIFDQFEFIENMSKASDVYKYIGTISSAKGFANESLKDEQDKATLICSDKQKYRSKIQELEDMEMIRGSIHNFMSIINASPEKALEFFVSVFKEQNPIKVAGALLSISNYGFRFGGCQLGDRIYFGSKKNWYTLLTYRTSSASAPYADIINTLYNEYQLAPTGGNKLDYIINKNINSISKDSWRYYFVKYPEMLDTKDMNYAFKNILTNNIDIQMMSGTTLLSEHINPYYRVIASRLGKENCDVNTVSVRFSETGLLTLKNGFQLELKKDGWIVLIPEVSPGISIWPICETVKDFDTQSNELKFNPGDDYIEQGINLCNAIMKSFSII